MRKFIILFSAISLIAGCAQGAVTPLEKSVAARAESDPATADEYFLERIEDHATVEEQAIYLYGMGIAQEKIGISHS